MCHGRLHKKLVRVLLGFSLGLGVRESSDTDYSTVISMSHGIRPSSYISRRCSNFKLVWVSTRLSTSFWPNLFLLFEWIKPSIDQLCLHVNTEQDISTTFRSSHVRAGQGLKNVLIQTCMSDFMQSVWNHTHDDVHNGMVVHSGFVCVIVWLTWITKCISHGFFVRVCDSVRISNKVTLLIMKW